MVGWDGREGELCMLSGVCFYVPKGVITGSRRSARKFAIRGHLNVVLKYIVVCIMKAHLLAGCMDM